MRRVSAILFCECVLVFILSVPFVAIAKDITIVPAIAFRAAFDDNVLYSRVFDISDYVGIISPALKLNYASEIFNIRGSGLVDVLRYAQEKDLDYERQYYKLNGDYRFAERWKFNGDFAYSKDTTLQTELIQTGIVNIRSPVDRFDGDLGLAYQLSELSNIGVKYRYVNRSYKAQGMDDYYANSISLPYNLQFNDGLDIFTISPRYARLISENNDSHDYRLMLGWTHRPSETYQFKAFLGPRYTVQKFEDTGETNSNWGVVGDINLKKTAEVYSILVGFGSDVFMRPSTDTLNQVFRLYTRLSRRITERFRARVYSRISMTRPDYEDVGNEEDIWYFVVTPSLNYYLTENHYLSLAYSYQQQYDRNITHDPRIARNRIWLTLNLNFPKKW
jgi:hypothetical protein